jgi:hypothetical protein
MSRFPRTLSLILTLGLFLASCRPQTADRRPQADGGQTTVPSPALVLSPSPTPTPTLTPTSTPTEIPRPSLESLGLSAETRAVLTRQGWLITWDAQNARYTLSQRSWDETNQNFTDETTHEVGYIDLEGRLHFTATYFSAQENEDGTWKNTSTTQDIVVDLKNFPENPDLIIKQQLDENGNPISFQEKLKTPGFHLLETKNPAFEKTGILTLTYLDENGAPQVVTYNRELNFLKMPEISTDPNTPTAMPKKAIEAYAHIQFLTLQYGDKPFPKAVFRNEKGENIFPGWSLQFHYYQDGTKDCILWPRSGETSKYIRFWGQEEQKIPWFITIFPNGESYITTAVEIFNPKNPQDPQDGNEKLTLMVTLGKMNPHIFKIFYLDPELEQYLYKLAKRQLLITLAQEGGHFAKANFHNDAYDISSLDSLLGMEGNDVSKLPYWSHDIEVRLGEVGTNSNIIEVILSSLESVR